MVKEAIRREYFDWLYKLVCDRRYSSSVSFRKLLKHLHSIEFIYLISRDRNRAEDGVDLRYRYAWVNGYEADIDLVLDSLGGPCSVLEMMVALAIRCEENIMDDPNVGNRTSQWFWGMLVNLDIADMTDDRFNKRLVSDIINRFLYREYSPDGRGGLFTVRGRNRDLRDVEIWDQLNWYLDSIT